jgi:hypothetical protein
MYDAPGGDALHAILIVVFISVIIVDLYYTQKYYLEYKIKAKETYERLSY